MPRPVLNVLASAAGLVAVSCAARAATVPRIDQIVPIALHDGINPVPGFMPDGGTATIVQAWRGNGNAHGYQDWLVLAPSGEGHAAAVVTHEDPRNHLLADLVTAAPFDGERVLSTVRFARGRVDGRPASLLIDAALDPAPGGVLADHDVATIRIYRLAAMEDDPGDSPQEFRLIATQQTRARFCNADVALSRTLNLPPPPGMASTAPSADGCPPAR